LKDGEVVETYDAQAENSSAKYWVPLTLETIIIAVDRDKTDMQITTWSDLSGSEVNVSMPDTAPVSRLAVAALCYGLEGEDFTLAPAVRLLEPLYADGFLKFDDASAPVQICFDSDAAARIKNGENIEIIVPLEGTLTYVRGLLSNAPVTLPDDYEQVLLDSGFRLPDGRTGGDVYPSPGQYETAKILEDYNHLNTVTQDWTRVQRRDIIHTRLYTSADGREHLIFAAVFIVLAVIWVGSMMRRSQQGNIRRIILTMGFLIAGWVLIRIIKFQIDDETALGLYLWYAYYFFQACLPLVMVRIASLIGTPSGQKSIPKWFAFLCAFNMLLVVLVFTNNLHGMMFEIDFSMPGWSENGNYGYGVLYYIVTVVLLVELFAGIIIMYLRAKYSPRRFAFIFPVIFSGVLIAYVAGYATGIPVFAETDMTLIICAFGLLFVELCMRSGQIPVNMRYRELFQNTGINLQITDADGNSMLSSYDARPLDARQWLLLKNSDQPVYPNENTLLLKYKIDGGYAVWQEDVTAMNELKAELDASNQKLARSNDILSDLAQAKEQAAQIKAKTNIYAILENDIAAYEKRLDNILKELSDNKNPQGQSLVIAACLTCHIKRRCQMIVSEMSGNRTITCDDMQSIFNEIVEIARLAGTESVVSSGVRGSIDIRWALLFYSLLASLLEWVETGPGQKISVLIEAEKNTVVMRIFAEPFVLAFEPSAKLAEEIEAADGSFEKKDMEDMACILLSFPAVPLPEGGGRDA
jgi:hypothetical protein